MKSMKWILAILYFAVTAAAAGCGSSQATRPLVPITGELLVRGTGTAATEDEAYQIAMEELSVALYGSDAWLDAVSVPAHDRTRDPMERTKEESGQVRVVVGLVRERVAELLAGLIDQPSKLTVPPALAGAFELAYEAHVQKMICERQQRLLGETCTPPDTTTVDAQLAALAGQIELRAVYGGGVPLDANGLPLRPIRVVVEMVGADGAKQPLSGIPLIAATPAGAQILQTAEAATGDAGIASFALVDGAVWPEDMRVLVDRERLLGPLASVWTDIELAVKGRGISVPRWTLVATERVKRNGVMDGVFASTVNQRVRERGANAMATLPLDAMPKLAAIAPNALPAALPALADDWGGRVDVLLVATVDTEFASRMGANSVWYEARARVIAYDVWTGKQLAVMEDTATASGVGDDRANRAARTQLADKLANALVPLLTGAGQAK